MSFENRYVYDKKVRVTQSQLHPEIKFSTFSGRLNNEYVKLCNSKYLKFAKRGTSGYG